MDSPNPGTGHPEEGVQDGGSAMLLGELDDGRAAGGVKEEGDKGGRGAIQGILNW